jgi:hypothetical protein
LGLENICGGLGIDSERLEMQHRNTGYSKNTRIGTENAKECADSNNDVADLAGGKADSGEAKHAFKGWNPLSSPSGKVEMVPSGWLAQGTSRWGGSIYGTWLQTLSNWSRDLEVTAHCSSDTLCLGCLLAAGV